MDERPKSSIMFPQHQIDDHGKLINRIWKCGRACAVAVLVVVDGVRISQLWIFMVFYIGA